MPGCGGRVVQCPADPLARPAAVGTGVLTALAAKLGRAVYYMLLRGRPFELQRFVTV